MGHSESSGFPMRAALATTPAQTKVKGIIQLEEGCINPSTLTAAQLAVLAKIPILIEYGSADTTIPPPSMACVTDRLGPNGDNISYSFCLTPGVGHEGVVRAQSSYVADWLASQTMGEPAPAPCSPGAGGQLTDDAGTPLPCQTPPPNN